MDKNNFIEKISSLCSKEGITNSELLKLKKENLTKEELITGITNLAEDKKAKRAIELEEKRVNEAKENIDAITSYIKGINEQIFEKFVNEKPSWYKDPSTKVEFTNLLTPVEGVKVSNFPEQKEFPKEIKVTNFPEYPKPLEKVEVTNLKDYPEPLKEIKVTNLKEFPKQIDIKKPDWYKEPKDKIEITNLKEFPKEIKITNPQKNIIIDNDVSLKEPSWIEKLLPDNNIVKKISDSIGKILDKVTNTSVGRIIKNKFIVKTERENPLSVVLVDPVTKNPTELNVRVSGGGGGYQDTIGLKNASEVTINPATEEKQDDIVSELQDISAQATFNHGRKSTIGTTAVRIIVASTVAKHGVLVKAANDNTGTIYVGNSNVTADTTDATDGFELGAGESVTVPINNANKIYVIGSVAGQKVFWVTV